MGPTPHTKWGDCCGIISLQESCSFPPSTLCFFLSTATTLIPAWQPLPHQPTESSWRQEAFLGAKTLQGKDLENTPICPAWKLAPTSAEKARQSQLGIRGKWGQAGAGARSCKIFHVCQHRSCRPVCSFHLGLLLTRQQNVLKGEIRRIIFIPSILWLGWFLLCCKTIALCNLSSLKLRGAKCSPSSVCSTPRSCAVAPPKQATRLQPGQSWDRKIRVIPDGKSSWSSCTEVWQKELWEEKLGLFGCNPAAIGHTWD